MIIRWLYRKLRARRTARVAGRTAGEPTPRRAGADHGGLPALVQVAAHEFRYDLRAFLRNRQSRFFTLALPVLFLVIFASVFGGSNRTGIGCPQRGRRPTDHPGRDPAPVLHLRGVRGRHRAPGMAGQHRGHLPSPSP